MFHVPEEMRLKTGPAASDFTFGKNGAFVLPPVIGSRQLWIIASDGLGWEHVSVHAYEGKRSRLPTWTEMCVVKETFWDEEDVVMQLHPRRSEYINNHPHVLHLWRPTTGAIPEPPSLLVGLKDESLAMAAA